MEGVKSMENKVGDLFDWKNPSRPLTEPGITVQLIKDLGGGCAQVHFAGEVTVEPFRVEWKDLKARST